MEEIRTSTNNFVGQKCCVTETDDFGILTHPIALEANLRSVWMSGVDDPKIKEITNK